MNFMTERFFSNPTRHPRPPPTLTSRNNFEFANHTDQSPSLN